MPQAVNVIFYVNLCLLFCALIEMTAVIVLCRKTSCSVGTGRAAVILFALGIAMFIVQLVVYLVKPGYAEPAVYICTVVLYAGFLLSGTYACMLSRNSHKKQCFVTGALNLLPPIGAGAFVKLSYTIKRDTPAQELVYNGYAYTYAALGDFCAKNGATFADMSGDEQFDPLSGKEAKKLLSKLKKNAVTPRGIYDYAAALANYRPDKMKTAVKYMRRAADYGVAGAMFNLGYYHELGIYVKKDHKKAGQYYARAAETGDADAALRLCILDIAGGDIEGGISKLKDRAVRGGDLCAKYNLAVCAERGIGFTADIDRAVELYAECADGGLFLAQKRIFSLAADNINSAQNGEFFRKVTDRTFADNSFMTMISGLIEVKKRHAADAAEYFLQAVRMKGRWEGYARCFVGTLYLDCGKQDADRINGAEFIRSAVDIMPDAISMYAAVPASIIREAERNVRNSRI